MERLCRWARYSSLWCPPVLLRLANSIGYIIVASISSYVPGVILCCPLVHVIKSRQAHLINATYEVLAKYNKYLFKPRNIQVIHTYTSLFHRIARCDCNIYYIWEDWKTQQRTNITSFLSSISLRTIALFRRLPRKTNVWKKMTTIRLCLWEWNAGIGCAVCRTSSIISEKMRWLDHSTWFIFKIFQVHDDQLQSKFIMSNRLYQEQQMNMMGASGSSLSLTMDRSDIW